MTVAVAPRRYTGGAMVTKKPATPRKRKPTPKKAVSKDPTLWSDIIAIGKSIPPEERARIPADAATYFDDYIEGRRKHP